MTINIYTAIFASLFFLHHGFEFLIDILQFRHLSRPRTRVPKHLEGKIDLETIQKAVAYNKDKLRFGMVTTIIDIITLWLMVAVGFSIIDGYIAMLNVGPIVSGLIFFGMFAGLSGIISIPAELYSTFGIEARHGFNKQTFRGFVIDKIKATLVGSIVGAAIMSLLLLFMEKGGEYWWLIAFIGVALFQLLMIWIYPVLIMPLFNKFTPVSDDLREAVSTLATNVKFPLKSVFAMDGSKRSKHSNAFIIGLKGARKIVLYDTLIEEIDKPKLLAVLAHELGHFKLKHLTKRIAWMLVSMLVMFYALSIMRNIEGLYLGLGFERVTHHAALVVFSLMVSEVLAPTGWLSRIFSRRDEKGADRFAVEAIGNGYDLADALIALNKQNLASPGSHKLYRHYHNSHPALKERLRVIKTHAENLKLPTTAPSETQ